MCPSVGPNPGSDCCFPGKGQCSDQNLFDCATSVNQDCLVSWTECCVNVLQAEGLCDSATPIDAGT
jgi:hypothetical protein